MSKETYRIGGDIVSERDFATFVLPVAAAILRHEEGRPPLKYVHLSPRFDGGWMTHTPKLWIEGDVMRLAWCDEHGVPDKNQAVQAVQRVLRLDSLGIVMLHTDTEEIYVLTEEEYSSQV
jgi:hypothetical protein